jgi:tetratricopeptide (TPR) repeat protein
MKKNGKKSLSLTIAVLLGIVGVSAGSNERGIDLYRAELYDAAKIFFLEQQNQSTQEQAENQYYLGQSYYKLQQTDSAAYFYNKAVNTDPNYPFGYIGQGKIALLQENKKDAEALFKKASSLGKKDPSVQTAIAEVYIGCKMYPQAEETLDNARKINKKYSGIYVAEGDMLMQEDKLGDACARYDNAIAFAPNDKIAYLKLAQVYKNVSKVEALKYLNQLIAIDPNYIPAYSLFGDIYREDGYYIQALDAYEKFIAIPGVPLSQHIRYAYLLYYTDQYEKSLERINYVLQYDPNNLVMHRFEAYNNFKLNNSALAVQQLNDFLRTTPDEDIIYLDYITLGRALLKEKQPKKAIEILLKAEEKDNSKSEIYKELIDAYEATKDYVNAIKMYEKFYEIDTAPASLDYFYYGQANYFAASKYIVAEDPNVVISPEQQAINDEALKIFMEKGNTAFTEVIKLSPKSYLGYYWKALLNSFFDASEQAKTGTIKGIAKPFYEEALEVMLNNNENGKRNLEIIAAYNYLASYYILMDESKNAGEYYKKILEIDPNNEAAKQTLNALKIKY